MKDLTITDSPDKINGFRPKKYIKIAPLQLIGAPSRDNLISFTSGFELDPHIISLLLRNQSCLRTLTVITHPKYSSGLPGSNYVRGNLSELRSLVLRVHGTQCDTYDRLGIWFAHAPILIELIVDREPKLTNSFNGWKLSTDTPLLKLRRLCLRNLTFSDTTASVPSQIYIPSLRFLIIDTCSNTSTLLNAFTVAFKSSEDRSLDTFIHESLVKDDHVSTVEFLKTLKGVDHVELKSRVLHNSYLSFSTIFAQMGHTLRFLHIGNVEGTRYNTHVLNELCQVCPNLEVLSLTLVSMRQDIDELDESEDCQLTAQDMVTLAKTKLMDSLVCS